MDFTVKCDANEMGRYYHFLIINVCFGPMMSLCLVASNLYCQYIYRNTKTEPQAGRNMTTYQPRRNRICMWSMTLHIWEIIYHYCTLHMMTCTVTTMMRRKKRFTQGTVVSFHNNRGGFSIQQLCMLLSQTARVARNKAEREDSVCYLYSLYNRGVCGKKQEM